MTTKQLKFLSPPDNTIDILTDSGVGGTLNLNPCRYEIAEKVENDDAEKLLVLISVIEEGLDDEAEEKIGILLMKKE